jgi:TetR/AcrR family fatty acid metabolism transcriptional regulator
MGRKSGAKGDLIIEAAVKVIAANGFHHSKISMIAQEAQIADGTVYLYFDNKNDLLVKLFHQKMSQFVRFIQEEIKCKENPAEQLELLILRHFQYIQQYPDFARLMTIELRQSIPAIRGDIHQTSIQYVEVIKELLLAGRKKGVFSRRLNCKEAAAMIYAALDYATFEWIITGEISLAERAKEIEKLALAGLKK